MARLFVVIAVVFAGMLLALAARTESRPAEAVYGFWTYLDQVDDQVRVHLLDADGRNDRIIYAFEDDLADVAIRRISAPDERLWLEVLADDDVRGRREIIQIDFRGNVVSRDMTAPITGQRRSISNVRSDTDYMLVMSSIEERAVFEGPDAPLQDFHQRLFFDYDTGQTVHAIDLSAEALWVSQDRLVPHMAFYVKASSPTETHSVSRYYYLDLRDFSEVEPITDATPPICTHETALETGSEHGWMPAGQLDANRHRVWGRFSDETGTSRHDLWINYRILDIESCAIRRFPDLPDNVNIIATGQMQILYLVDGDIYRYDFMAQTATYITRAPFAHDGYDWLRVNSYDDLRFILYNAANGSALYRYELVPNAQPEMIFMPPLGQVIDYFSYEGRRLEVETADANEREWLWRVWPGDEPLLLFEQGSNHRVTFRRPMYLTPYFHLYWEASRYEDAEHAILNRDTGEMQVLAVRGLDSDLNTVSPIDRRHHAPWLLAGGVGVLVLVGIRSITWRVRA